MSNDFEHAQEGNIVSAERMRKLAGDVKDSRAIAEQETPGRSLEDYFLGAGSPGGTAIAYNASGEDVPYGGVVEIGYQDNYDHTPEFVKPGSDRGVFKYGIALEPVPKNHPGLIAVSGGPWPVYCTWDPWPGLIMSHVDGFWEVSYGYGREFACLRDRKGEHALVFFNQTKLDRHHRADSSRLIQEVGNAIYLYYQESFDGTSWTKDYDTWVAWKWDDPLPVYTPRERLGLVLGGADFDFHIFYNQASDASGVEQVYTRFMVSYIIEEFNLSTLDKDTLASLSKFTDYRILRAEVASHPGWQRGRWLVPGPWGPSLGILFALPFKTEDYEVYGVSFHIDYVRHYPDTPVAGDVRRAKEGTGGFDAGVYADLFRWVFFA